MKTLENKRIVLGVTGSIAAVETVKLAHELIRRGAEVIPVLSEAATSLISPDALTYACHTPAITRISGMVEHVLYCGEGGKADLLLIAPSTANTISKIACGIDDTPVTTFATTALGRGMPIVLAPAMHESMYRHPIVKKNLQVLNEIGIDVVPPKVEEEKAKIADIETICLYVERALSNHSLEGKKVLITSGSCREKVDSVRILTTRSSGRMGKELALEAFRRGADVTVISNTEVHGIVPCVKNISIVSAHDMMEAVNTNLNGVSFYVSAAAISDFAPVQSETKIPSGKPVSLKLTPLPKILSEVSKSKAKIIAFKIGENAVDDGKKMLNEKNVILVAANNPSTMGSSDGEYILLGKKKNISVSGEKDLIAREIWDTVR